MPFIDPSLRTRPRKVCHHYESKPLSPVDSGAKPVPIASSRRDEHIGGIDSPNRWLKRENQRGIDPSLWRVFDDFGPPFATSEVPGEAQKINRIMEKFADRPHHVILIHLVRKFIAESIGKEIEKATTSIYISTTKCLHHVFIRKVKILRAPKFDLGKLMELKDVDDEAKLTSWSSTALHQVNRGREKPQAE